MSEWTWPPHLPVGGEMNIGCDLHHRVLILGAISSRHVRVLMESSEQKVFIVDAPIHEDAKTKM